MINVIPPEMVNEFLEERIDKIGQNGNDGEHYEEIDMPCKGCKCTQKGNDKPRTGSGDPTEENEVSEVVDEDLGIFNVPQEEWDEFVIEELPVLEGHGVFGDGGGSFINEDVAASEIDWPSLGSNGVWVEPAPEIHLIEPEKSDGSTASYYELPEGATELQDIISADNMNAQMGEIGRAWKRYGKCSHSDKMRDIRKIQFYAKAEEERLLKYGSD